ncbi:hypothetical protein INS49_014513 [Diaporthe citri]|uniref:uncharacterized protein n=1 Tax=Diaporthe citri TaxID=83186 RepID=UPI001C8139F5|nr:uncharacterized protein INS49_014513 [Diaporthe citri]KAG6356639.1 hypothetical protein INS49_014513 [Diaporthe citri]
MLQRSASAAREKSPSGSRSGAGAGAATGPDQTGPSSNVPPIGLKQTVSRNSAARSHSGSTARTPKWWKIRLFKGMVGDLRRRAPYYWSDWKDALDYRVVPATVYMYFANILPALAFSLDMFTRTHSQYGVNEVLLASVLGSVVFSVLACQPLVIVGVTGPITVFNYTVYDIMEPTGVNYLAFMCWIGLWALVMHWILAATNSCNWLRYVTRFPCDIFGFYVAFIYLQKGVQVLTLLGDREPFYLSVMAAMLVFFIAYACGQLGASSLFHHHVRVFLKDYGTPLTVIFFTGFVHIGRMKQVSLESLPTSDAFFPTQDRGWLVHFWDIRVADVFLAVPFAVLLTILFWFDHNVSSLIAQGTEFPLRKPPGFHWDIFLLGLTTGVAGILGIPFPNGLIPQAPFHTESLCVTKVVHLDSSDSSNVAGGKASGAAAADDDEGGDRKGRWELRRTHVVEQRVSNLAQGLLTLGTMTGPLLALEGNGVTAKILFLLRDGALTPASSPLRRIRRRSRVWLFVALALVGFGATFAITQTVAAVGFPVFIIALIPARALLLPRLFTPQELAILDAPTASPFTMESVGGTYGGETPDLEGDGSSSTDANLSGGTGGGLFRGGEGDAVGGIDRRKSEAELAELGESRGMRRRGSAVVRDNGDGGSAETKSTGMSRRVTSGSK